LIYDLADQVHMFIACSLHDQLSWFHDKTFFFSPDKNIRKKTYNHQSSVFILFIFFTVKFFLLIFLIVFMHLDLCFLSQTVIKVLI
jgi:hypothetical protein